MDDDIDETLEQTFPASDPPANTPETGILLDGHAPIDNRADRRFEIRMGDHVAFLKYERRPDAMVLIHTEVPTALEGRGVGSALVRAGLDAARAEGLRVIALCPFVKQYLKRHPDAV